MPYRMPGTLQGKISTLGGLGYLTHMPGTVGSVAAFLVAMIHPVPLWAIAAGSILGAGLLGWLGAWAGKAPAPRAVLRVTFWGAIAMAVTYGIGKLAGTTV